MKSRKLESLIEEYVNLLYTFDFYYTERNDIQEWREGTLHAEYIRKVMNELHKRGITEHEIKTIYNEYAPEDRFKYKGL